MLVLVEGDEENYKYGGGGKAEENEKAIPADKYENAR